MSSIRPRPIPVTIMHETQVVLTAESHSPTYERTSTRIRSVGTPPRIPLGCKHCVVTRDVDLDTYTLALCPHHARELTMHRRLTLPQLFPMEPVLG